MLLRYENPVQSYEFEFGNEKEEFDSADSYRLENESLLQYINTPKIIVTNNYNLQASYDPVGKHMFSDGVGVVLGAPIIYHYVTAVLNSSISRAFPRYGAANRDTTGAGCAQKC